jgi:pSer/pThr/pTyr-binding forkhead associated (FHA) protein
MIEWILEVRRPGKEPVHMDVTDGMTIGRHLDNVVFLDDSGASSHHAEIRQVDGSFRLVDLGSTNKTKLQDGHKLGKDEWVPLKHGLVIKIGKSALEVKSAAEIEAAGSPTVHAKVRSEASSGSSTSSSSSSRGVIKGGSADPSSETARREAPAAAGVASPAAETSIKDLPPEIAAEIAAELEGMSPEEQRTIAAVIVSEDKLDRDALGKVAGGEISDTLLKYAEWRTAGARLIVSSEALRQRVDFIGPTVVVGRSTDPAQRVTCHLPHDGVSMVHARVVFQKGHFYVEDLGSMNGTYIGSELLQPNQPREITTDQRLRFGPIEAVFVSDQARTGIGDPRQWYAEAGDVLVEGGYITRLALKKGQKEASESDTSIGEALLLSGHITCRQWVDALEKAMLMAMVKKELNVRVSGLRRMVVIVWILLFMVCVLLAVQQFS